MRAVADLLKSQPKESKGTYRALASRWVEGQAGGPFSYKGTRSDDPNDTIPHEDRPGSAGFARVRLLAESPGHEVDQQHGHAGNR